MATRRSRALRERAGVVMEKPRLGHIKVFVLPYVSKLDENRDDLQTIKLVKGSVLDIDN